MFSRKIHGRLGLKMKNSSKKLLAGILTAIATIATIIASMLSGGCSVIQGKKLTNAVGDVAQATSVICETAKIFSDAGADIPNVEQCDKILPVLNSDEMAVVISVLECSEKSKIESPEFAECAGRAGWPVLKTRLQQLSE